MPHPRALTPLALSLAATLMFCGPAWADDGWNPFAQPGEFQSSMKKPTAPRPADPARPPLASIDGRLTPPGTNNTPTEPAPPQRSYPAGDTSGLSTAPDERSRSVERGELAPLIATDGSGLPYELWRGLDTAGLEAALAKLDIPPRSPAVHALWRRLLTSGITPPSGAASGGEAAFAIVRAEALYRSGLVEDAGKVLAAARAPDAPLALVALDARVQIGAGRTEQGCALAKTFVARKGELPKALQGEALLLTGLCAAANGNPQAAGLVAELARDEKSADATGLVALDAIAAGSKTPVRGIRTPISLLHYRAFALAGGIEAKDIMDHGEPALLATLALDPSAEPALKLAASEAALRANALTPAAVAELYRALGASAAPETLLATNAVKTDPAAHRAALFKAAEAERTPLKKVRVIRALLDDARRSGLYLQMLEMLARTAEAIQPVPEIGWFAETGVEIALASGNPERARQWTTLGGAIPGDNGLRHWQALIDIADPGLKGDRGRALGPVEELATHGRMPGDLMHRLATVLDAQDINVPIPLWEAASRAPQPTGGYLPETGVLSELQDASKKKEFGRTVLLVMRTLGPHGAEGANIIALGDSIRALRRAGLEADARRLSFEALFALWPRSAAN